LLGGSLGKSPEQGSFDLKLFIDAHASTNVPSRARLARLIHEEAESGLAGVA
jgi:hypothetical protein